MYKITQNSMKNSGSTPILTNLVGVHPRNIHTKFEANPCSGSREEVNNGILQSDIVLHCKYTSYLTTQKLISIIQ